ncbi:ras-related protein Rab-32 isoform X2 [Anabrus simplex]|uniref:ras-related protein Rab-32 isoform X2 n=1 Tax=Anabrus simplex TaxID=316456 RepID=UPI0034DDBB9C
MNHEGKRDWTITNGNGTTREMLFKFLVIGDYGVGKTAIVRRYTEGKFSSNYKITIGADFAIKSLQWDGNTKINLQLWVAAAIVFDVSRLATFQSIPKWLNDLREKVTLHDGCPIPIVLLANKCDIHGTSVPHDLITKFCKENGIAAWFLTSAKENVNIEDSMTYLVQKVVNLKAQEAHNDSIILRDSGRHGNTLSKEKSSCCG